MQRKIQLKQKQVNQYCFREKKTIISHKELILIYNWRETKQRNHAWGHDPLAALFISELFFFLSPIEVLKKKKMFVLEKKVIICFL